MSAAAALHPGFHASPSAGEEVPPVDPSHFRALINAARPDDHPVWGFVENLSRWYSWYLAEKRADLAMRNLNDLLGPAGEEAE